jgi:hypothetical protein
MRVLLLQPEDWPSRGPWSREKWDLIVDLGKSSAFSAQNWSRVHNCPVMRSDSFREGVSDVRRVRDLFSAGRGRLIDEEGIDWWDLTSLLVAQEALTVLALRKLAAEISASAELWTTRPGGPAALLAVILGRTLQKFEVKGIVRWGAHGMRYAGLARRFSTAQIKEIFLDKYDPAYLWRGRFATRQRASVAPVVLIPSAYGNVSRMAAAYARLLPQQAFLTVATRNSGKQFAPLPNVQVRDLAAYAKGDAPDAEITLLEERWKKLRADFSEIPDLQLLARTGVLTPIAGWVRDGLSIRNAWREVLQREPVCGVLCGDDSNRYTLLPVLLAARRKIPTVDFHHGAFDGRYLLKDLPCDTYMAKNEMEQDYLLRVCGLPAERIVISAPWSRFAHRPLENQASQNDVSPNSQANGNKTSAILFSEPYEVVGMRGEEVYRELLPPLCHLARAHGHDVVVKLHPFESRSARSKMIKEILTRDDAQLVSVVDGPLNEALMARAWFGITAESTSVMDCQQSGIQCFLCGWLTLWPFEYVPQYARFGVGEVLHSVEEVAGIPGRLEEFRNRGVQRRLATSADPELLRRLLTSGLSQRAGARTVS